MKTLLAICICIVVFPPRFCAANSVDKERGCPKDGGELCISFGYNIVGVDIDQTETYTASFTNLRAESGFSNFETSLAITGTTIDLTTTPYCGIINITGSGSLTLDTITDLMDLAPINGPGIQNFRIQPVSTLTSLTISASSTISLLGGATSIILNGATGDYCEFWTDGYTAWQNSPANNY